jgi:protease-4
VDRIYDTFTSHVAEGRNLDIKEVLEIAEGRVWSGATASKIGLVDAIGGINEAVGKAMELADIKANYKLCEFVAPLSPFEEWLSSMTMVYAKQWGLNSDIYGEEIRNIINEMPEIFQQSGVQTRVAGDLKLKF